MKNWFKLLLVTLSIMLVAACGNSAPDLEDRVDAEPEASSYKGVIENFDIDIYNDGTHQIQTEDGEIIVIQSSIVNLNNYLDKEVVVSGEMESSIDGKAKVFNVKEVVIEGGMEDGESNEYENSKFGFMFNYPSLWELLEETQSITLRGNGKTIVVIDVFSTDVELDEFVTSKEIEDGTPITIGSQRSLRYTEEGEIRIYSSNPSKEKVYKIIFQGTDEQKEFFYSFLESFKVLVSKTKSGEKCGGKENIVCPEEFRCELTSGEEDAEGICISVDDIELDLDCPYVSTPTGCTNYETKNLNKDGCPTSYECLDEPEESMESEDFSAELDDEAMSDEPDEEVAEVSEVEKVVMVFTKHQETILPDGAEVVQFEVIDQQNLIAAVYLVDDQKFRTLFSYTSSADEFNFEKEAHFEAGEERDWILLDGEEVLIRYEQKIVKAGSDGGVQTILDGMRLYENPHKDFSVQYPKNWYYRSFGSIENTVWTVGFGEDSMDHVTDSKITLEILDEMSLGKKEMKGDNYLIEVERDDDSHFLLTGPLEMKEELDDMATTIVQN